MGIALISFAGLFMPLHSLAVRWMPVRKGRSGAALRYVAVRPACTARPALGTAHPTRPLRVVRMVDTQPARSAGGRMVISGRMADVCAELDRLAALEEAMPKH